MKRALIARDKHCRFPGCDMPPAWTDGHHIKHWANGGPHELWNLLLLCRRHHRYFHEGGWTLQQAEGGLQAIPP
jgi:predicted restriction endonuclease